MNAFCKLSSALVLAGALATPAFAASGDTNNEPTTGAAGTNSNPSMTAAPNGAGMHVAQKMRDDLSRAGFTDIRIMPSSFLVRAKDSSGNPVMMVINPDSITAITEDNGGTNAANAGNHSSGTANSAGATPGPQSTGGSQPVTPGDSQRKP
jgi:hypothetical protein